MRNRRHSLKRTFRFVEVILTVFVVLFLLGLLPPLIPGSSRIQEESMTRKAIETMQAGYIELQALAVDWRQVGSDGITRTDTEQLLHAIR